MVMRHETPTLHDRLTKATKIVYKITHPNGKIYVGKALTDSIIQNKNRRTDTESEPDRAPEQSGAFSICKCDGLPGGYRLYVSANGPGLAPES